MLDAKTKSLFITGGTGFIGSHVLRHLLEQGYRQIRALHRPDSSFERIADIRDQVEWVEGDLLDVVFLEEALQGCTIVIHCAGFISYHKKDRDQLELINVTATARLVDIASYHNVQHFIHLSSTAALGRDRQGEMIHEKSKWENNNLNTAYAISKFRGDQEVWRGAAEGLAVSVLHPSMVLGNNNWNQGIGRMFAEVWQGLRYYPSGGNGVVDVKDIAKVIEERLHHPAQNERYILAAANYSYQKLLNEIAQALDKPAPDQVLPKWQVHLYRHYKKWRAYVQNRPPVLTKDSMRNMLHRVHFDNTKSKKKLGIQYRPPAESIREMGVAFLEEKKAPAGRVKGLRP